MSREDKECEKHFARMHYRQSDGRYVDFPSLRDFPSPVHCPISLTRRSAERVLKAIKAKFKRDAAFQALYTDFMRQYADLGHMSLVSLAAAPHPACFLPHHGVMRKASTTTQLRVVFNGSFTLPDWRVVQSTSSSGIQLPSSSVGRSAAVATASLCPGSRLSNKCTGRSIYTRRIKVCKIFSGVSRLPLNSRNFSCRSLLTVWPALHSWQSAPFANSLTTKNTTFR